MTVDPGAHLAFSPRDVACSVQNIPENANITTGNVKIYRNGAQWISPSQCTWTCKPGFKKEGNTCVSAATPASCFGFSNGTITSYQWHNCPSDVIIPKTINGVPVTAIGERAFAGWTEEIYGNAYPDEW